MFHTFDTQQWPVVIQHGPLVLRPLKRSDKNQWYRARDENRQWLQEWEATTPYFQAPLSFNALRRILHRDAKEGVCLPFAVELNGVLIGQITVAHIQYGSACSAVVGYWISQEYAGRGIMPLAVALAVNYCFETLELHRIEIHIRPENHASLRIVEKLGFRKEGYRKEYLHINGAWADHFSFALLHDEFNHEMIDQLSALAALETTFM